MSFRVKPDGEVQFQSPNQHAWELQNNLVAL